MRIIFNKFTIIGGVVITLVLALYAFLLLTGTQFKDAGNSTPVAALTVIPAGAIPTQDLSLLVQTPTPTLVPEVVDQKGIGIGKYVQITGTGGAGLRFREGAGTTFTTKFLANESEVFKVIGGPVTADDIAWYQLVAPYDEARQGWASAEYLVIIEGQ